MIKKIILFLSLLLASTLIIFLFKWQEDVQKLRYWELSKQKKRHIDPKQASHLINFSNNIACYFHFVGNNCPYNQLGYESLISLHQQYRKQVSFAIVYENSQSLEQAKEWIQNHNLENIQLIHDKDKKLRKAFGVQSLPRAVIINNELELCYEGNYNHSSILCGFGAIDYGGIALNAIIKGESIPPIGYFVLKETDCI